jgi:hypothetical protein
MPQIDTSVGDRVGPAFTNEYEAWEDGPFFGKGPEPRRESDKKPQEHVAIPKLKRRESRDETMNRRAQADNQR